MRRWLAECPAAHGWKLWSFMNLAMCPKPVSIMRMQCDEEFTEAY